MPAQFTKHFVQDLQQDIKIRQCGSIVFNKDNESNIISVDLYNGQEEYSGGGSVAGACICPDGSTVPLTGSIDGKTASVTLTGDCFAFPGQIGIGVQVVSGTVKTTVLKAIYNVELFETDDVIDPGSRITASVGQLVQDIEQATAKIPASDMASLMSGIAPVFSASTNYAAGAYVYYSGTLYCFTNAHAAGSWTGTDATAVALGNDVSELKSAYDVIKVSLMDGTIPYAVNGTITGTTANGGISAEQTNNVITLNGTSTASSSQGWSKISLCEPFVAWRSATSPEEWTASKPITFFVNHIYQFLLTKKSGTFGGSIRFDGYDSSGQLIFDPVELLTTDTSKTYVYAPESDVNANLLIFAKTATTFTDAALEITVNDITFDTKKQDKLTFDTVPMANSTNPATSGGTYTDGTVAIQTSGTAVDEIIGASPLTFRNGVYKGTSDGTAMAGVPMYTSPGDQFICAECECKAGDTITINGNGSSGLYRMWYIVNTNGVIVDNANANISGMQKVTVSNGGVKIYVNLLKTSTNPYAYKGDKLNSSVPDYYANHLDEKIASINALNDTMDDSFIFLTDYHWQGNAQNSPALIKEIVKRTGISKLFFGGDAGRTSSSKYQAAEEDASIYGKLRNSVPHFYGMTGNHEWNEQQQEENEATPSSNAYSRKGVVNYYLDHDRQIASNMSPEGNYYVDSGKIRYFVIQCTGHARVTNATCEWLIGQLNAVPDGQFVVLISHAAYDGYAHSSNVEQYYGDRCRMSVLRLTQIMAAYKAKQASTDSGAIQINELADNFDASGSSPYITGTISYDFHSAHGTPICVFAGHVHYDYQNKPNGIYNVFTTTDAYGMEDANKSSLTRTAGTITEQAFDVVHIDLTNRQFRLTRIGAGEDRGVFSF